MLRSVLNVLTGGARNDVAPVKLPDAALEFWGEIYRANPRLAERGLTFEQFLADPEAHLHDSARYQLPIAALVALKSALRSTQVVGNGRVVEKLRHHRHPRGAYRDFMGRLRDVTERGSR